MNGTLQSLVSNNMITIFGGICVVLLAGITAFLANRRIAVFNDGVRPLVGQAKQGNLKYRALAATSFAMSIGYVIGFIPFSIASNILVMHTILLGSEMIGLVCKKEGKFSIIAAVVAMTYGAAIYWGIIYLGKGIENITYPGFGFDLGMIVDGAFPFIFAMFPVVALFMQSGWKKGLFGVVASVVTYFVVASFGWGAHHLYPMAITLLVGTLLLFAFAIYDHKTSQKNKKTDTTAGNKIAQFNVFGKNAAEIKTNKWWFVVSGALASMVVASFASAPLVSMALQTSSKQTGDIISALIADTTWVIGFIPLVVITALLTGVYSPVGLTLVFVWGDVAKIIGAQIVSATGNQSMYLVAIMIGGVMGGASMFLETFVLTWIAKLLIKVPNVQKTSDAMRTGITKTINWAFLAGGIIAAFVMGQHVVKFIQGDAVGASLGTWLPSAGAGLVLLGIIVNSTCKKKFAEIAIGPLGAILVGILFNVIYFAII